MHVGSIGLGHLGRAIADRFIACGHTLTVWNRTPEKIGDIHAERGNPCPLPIRQNLRRGN